jgi:hypothetical protein
MHVDDILPALDLPAAAVQNRSIPKGSLMVHGPRPTEEEDRILKEIASIRLPRDKAARDRDCSTR